MNVAVVGLGVVGGSLALGLKGKPGYTVYGIDKDQQTIDTALGQGMITVGSCEPRDILPEADLVIICLYPEIMSGFVEENREYFRENAVLMDVTGIKCKIIDEVMRVKPEGVDFIFAHPMAGRESKGIAFASAEVLQGANFLITPIEMNRPENIQMVEKLALDCGFGKISKLSPEEHDRIIAFTSQLSHVIAISLINSDTEEYDTSRFIGDSYRGITRIASINQDLWAELFFGNKDNLLAMVDNFLAEVNILRDHIVREDGEGIKVLFQKAAERREKIQ